MPNFHSAPSYGPSTIIKLENGEGCTRKRKREMQFCNGREPDDFQPRAQIKRLFEESEVVSGDSEAIRKFSDKYIVPENLVAEYVEHLAQIKMRKEKKK